MKPRLDTPRERTHLDSEWTAMYVSHALGGAVRVQYVLDLGAGVLVAQHDRVVAAVPLVTVVQLIQQLHKEDKEEMCGWDRLAQRCSCTCHEHTEQLVGCLPCRSKCAGWGFCHQLTGHHSVYARCWHFKLVMPAHRM